MQRIACAEPIGVTTGIFTREELLAAAAPSCIILDDLSDTDKVIAAMGL